MEQKKPFAATQKCMKVLRRRNLKSPRRARTPNLKRSLKLLNHLKRRLKGKV
jgi:hypothetical protein